MALLYDNFDTATRLTYALRKYCIASDDFPGRRIHLAGIGDTNTRDKLDSAGASCINWRTHQKERCGK